MVNSLRILSALIFTFGAVSVSAEEVLNGNLELNPGVSLKLLSDQGRVEELTSGPVNLRKDYESFWGPLYNGAQSVTLSQGQNSGKFFLAFDNDYSVTSFATAETSGQNYGLRTEERLINVQTRTEDGINSCSHMGYCYGCGLGFDGKFDCSFGFKFSCAGTQQVREEIVTGETETVIQIFRLGPSEASSENVGKIRTSNKPYSRRAIVAELSSCG